ncbi:hypothetical protein B296_00045342 [Ensete ventricosum]|uniref:Uncharacterized protein n=1 Tax=Ensete ventricosum TaxID=4639 RepID=A0A426XWG1_ENSVE|nr:hypothetical protein B296_00045342 [Ensete ventricosum]
MGSRMNMVLQKKGDGHKLYAKLHAKSSVDQFFVHRLRIQNNRHSQCISS